LTLREREREERKIGVCQHDSLWWRFYQGKGKIIAINCLYSFFHGLMRIIGNQAHLGTDIHLDLSDVWQYDEW
jgi:hypothetical protein